MYAEKSTLELQNYEKSHSEQVVHRPIIEYLPNEILSGYHTSELTEGKGINEQETISVNILILYK
jgi:hypothetical protein